MKNLILLMALAIHFQGIGLERKSILKDRYTKATLHFIDGETLSGLAKIKTLLGVDTIKFKLEEDSEVSSWTDLMIKGITLHEEMGDFYFEYVQIHKTKRPRLFQVIEKGTVSLYLYEEDMWLPVDPQRIIVLGQSFFQSEYKLYAIRESETKATLLPKFRFRKIAKDYFSDCEVLSNKIQNREFKWEDIKDVIYYYNDFCVD